MTRSSRRASWFWLSLEACSPSYQLSLPIEPGDVVVLGRVDDPLQSQVWVAQDEHSRLESELTIESREDILLIRVPADQLIDPSGQPLSFESKQQITVGSEGGCARCLVPAGDGPQVIFPGDRCPPPPNAEVYLGDTRASRDTTSVFRNRTSLAFPGACGCSLPVTPARGALKLELLYPTEDASPLTMVTGDGNGGFVLFGTRELLSVSREGVRNHVRWTEATADTQLYREGPMTTGPSPDGRHIVLASSMPDPDGGKGLWSRIVLADANLTELARFEVPSERVQGVRSWNDLTLIGGFIGGLGLRSDRPSVWSCKLNPDRPICKNLLPDVSFGVFELLDLQVLGNGVIVAQAKGGELVLLEKAVDPELLTSTQYDNSNEGHLETQSGETLQFRITDRELPSNSMLSTLGPDLLTCEPLDSGNLRIRRISVAPSLDTQMVLDACIEGSGCVGFQPRPDGGRRVFVGGNQFVDLRLDDQGMRACGTLLTTTLELPNRALLRTASSVNGRGVLQDTVGRWYAETSSSAYSLFYGDSETDARGAVFVQDGDFRAFSATAQIHLATTDTVALPEPFPWVPSRAAFDPSTQRTGVIQGAEFRVLDADLSIRETASFDESFIAIEPLSAGRFLIATNTRLLYWNGERLELLNVEFDDPTTETREEKPEQMPLYYALGSSLGMGWVVGSQGLVIRVLPTNNGYAATRLAFLGRYHTGLDQRELTTIASVCPDFAYVATDGPSGAEAWSWTISGANLEGKLLPSGPPMLFSPARPDFLWPSPVGLTSVHGDDQSYVHARVSSERTQRIPFGQDVRSFATTAEEAILTTQFGAIMRLSAE